MSTGSGDWTLTLMISFLVHGVGRMGVGGAGVEIYGDF